MPHCIVFRVDASPIIGLGHLMRCLALSQGLGENDVEVVFVVNETTLAYCCSRHDWFGEVMVIPQMTMVDECNWLNKKCAALQADWLILDGYSFDYEYRRNVSNISASLAIFDDGNLCSVAKPDPRVQLVINWATQAEQLPYREVVPNASLCVGDNFRVLRQEFLKKNNTPWLQRRGLLLMFGGSDPFDLTLPLLTLFCQSAVRMPIIVVTGAAYQHTRALQVVISNSELSITHLHDCQNMAQVLGNARLVISAAGASQYELLSCATPCILTVVAENQRFASEKAAKQGWCTVKQYDDTQPTNTLKQLCELGLGLWQQPELLLAMHRHALEHQNEMGITRIINMLYPQATHTNKNTVLRPS
ncbi:MAG: UDP-2,4-diacetamido-2,4,6-trideoxy-beta-L-altropyranose hydrolase [Paraglaciecola sp.]|jgi:UDP-2,4-diacetamido-2,4,6-trideoxy-beta-L-altropyranose hydrolase